MISTSRAEAPRSAENQKEIDALPQAMGMPPVAFWHRASLEKVTLAREVAEKMTRASLGTGARFPYSSRKASMFSAEQAPERTRCCGVTKSKRTRGPYPMLRVCEPE